MLGGRLVQNRDSVDGDARADARDLRARAERAGVGGHAVRLAVCRHVRSNAIVLARDGATIGIGAGQMSRVDAVRIAVEKAQDSQPGLLAGAALASDAFFPFPDGPELAIERGRSPRSSSPAARCATRT